MIDKNVVVFCQNIYFKYVKKYVCTKECFILKYYSFNDDENYINIPQNIKDREIFIVCSLLSGDDFLKILLAIYKVTKYCSNVMLFIPYLGYSREHDKINSFSEIFIKTFLCMNVKSIFLIDPHARYVFEKEEYRNRINILDCKDIFIKNINKICQDNNISSFCFVAPDKGALDNIRYYSDYYKKEYFVAQKERDVYGKIKSIDIQKIINYENIFIIDDMIDSGNTITRLIDNIANKNKINFYIFSTHGVFSRKPVFLNYKCVKKIIVTNSLAKKIKSKKIVYEDIFKNIF
jgi:ribose-phosphate pyrophosphokinase